MKALAISGSLCSWLWLGTAWAQVPAPADPPPAPPAAPPAEMPPAEPPAAPPAETPPAAPPAAPAPEPPAPRVQWVAPGQAPTSPAEPVVQPPSEGTESWQLAGSHFVVSVERITSVLGWREESTATPTTHNLFGSNRETEITLETAGADVSILGAGGAVRSPSSLPRLAFDGVLSVGFTIGGAISYMHSSGEDRIHVGGTASDAIKLADQSIFVFAPRAGALLRPASNLGIWLRGGVSRTSITRTGHLPTADSELVDVEQTATLWNLTLDPQLLLVAAPHVAVSLGGLFDIGLPGTLESNVEGESKLASDIKASAYGASAGIVAIF